MLPKILATEKLSETSTCSYADLGGDNYVYFHAENDFVRLSITSNETLRVWLQGDIVDDIRR